jgi:hypothetical protein
MVLAGSKEWVGRYTFVVVILRRIMFSLDISEIHHVAVFPKIGLARNPIAAFTFYQHVERLRNILILNQYSLLKPSFPIKSKTGTFPS